MARSPHRFIGGALALASVLLGGCVQKPVLELYGARVAGVTPQGITLLMTMQVNNGNSFDVKVRNVRANVNLQHRYQLPYLQYDPEQWLDANASTLVAVPMTIPWPMVTPLLATSIGSPQVQYHMHGYADVTATRLLQIQRNDYMLDEDGAFSRFDLVVAAGRGVLGLYTPAEPGDPAPVLADGENMYRGSVMDALLATRKAAPEARPFPSTATF